MIKTQQQVLLHKTVSLQPPLILPASFEVVFFPCSRSSPCSLSLSFKPIPIFFPFYQIMTLLVIAAGFLDLYNLLMTQPAFSEWASRYNPWLLGRTLKNKFKRKEVLKWSYRVASVCVCKHAHTCLCTHRICNQGEVILPCWDDYWKNWCQSSKLIFFLLFNGKLWN